MTQGTENAVLRAVLCPRLANTPAGLDRVLDFTGIPSSPSVAHRIVLALERLGELHTSGFDREYP